MWVDNDVPAEQVLDIVLDSYRSELDGVIEEFLSKNPSERKFFEALMEMQEKILDLASTHIVGADAEEVWRFISHRVDEGDFESARSFPKALLLASQRASVEFLNRALAPAAEFLQRAQFLAGVAKPAAVSGRCRNLLGLVARCFLSGFDQECATMCRAAMETELKAEIPADERIRRFGGGKNVECKLDDIIKVAQEQGRITYEGRLAADRVREAGNNVLHRNPVKVKNSESLIRDALLVMHELDRSKSA